MLFQFIIGFHTGNREQVFQTPTRGSRLKLLCARFTLYIKKCPDRETHETSPCPLCLSLPAPQFPFSPVLPWSLVPRKSLSTHLSSFLCLFFSPCPLSPSTFLCLSVTLSVSLFLCLCSSQRSQISLPLSLYPSLFEYHSLDPCLSSPTLQPSLITQSPISGGMWGKEASRMRSPSRRQGFISLQKGCKFSLSLSTGRDLSYQVSEAGKHRRRQAERPGPRVRLE